jgi:glutamate/tyrosine decarboxylase-like PLP-dependent enzyme
VCARDDVGRVDLAALRRQLGELDGAPAVLLATAGEPNAGEFDPLAELADLAEASGAWLHVDGAFGLFAALSPRTAHLTEGIERADSIAADAHKWLNVPYESGFALVREPGRLGPAFGMPGAAYLPGPDNPRGGYGLLGPESSRRARALPIWATLAAYGRTGYRELVERRCDLAAHLAATVDEAQGRLALRHPSRPAVMGAPPPPPARAGPRPCGPRRRAGSPPPGSGRGARPRG